MKRGGMTRPAMGVSDPFSAPFPMSLRDTGPVFSASGEGNFHAAPNLSSKHSPCCAPCGWGRFAAALRIPQTAHMRQRCAHPHRCRAPYGIEKLRARIDPAGFCIRCSAGGIRGRLDVALERVPACPPVQRVSPAFKTSAHRIGIGAPQMVRTRAEARHREGFTR